MDDLHLIIIIISFVCPCDTFNPTKKTKNLTFILFSTRYSDEHIIYTKYARTNSIVVLLLNAAIGSLKLTSNGSRCDGWSFESRTVAFNVLVACTLWSLAVSASYLVVLMSHFGDVLKWQRCWYAADSAYAQIRLANNWWTLLVRWIDARIDAGVDVDDNKIFRETNDDWLGPAIDRKNAITRNATVEVFFCVCVDGISCVRVDEVVFFWFFCKSTKKDDFFSDLFPLTHKHTNCSRFSNYCVWLLKNHDFIALFYP